MAQAGYGGPVAPLCALPHCLPGRRLWRHLSRSLTRTHVVSAARCKALEVIAAIVVVALGMANSESEVRACTCILAFSGFALTCK